MQTFHRKSTTLIALSSLATAIVIQACGHDDGQAVAQAVAPTATAPDPIEGVFQSEVTLKDCTTGATIGAFRGLTAFHQGNTATADNNTPPSAKGVALGSWKRSATGSYTASFRFAAALPAGGIGQQRFTRSITLAADGTTLTSTLSTQLLDTRDNVIQSACGVETGVRY